MISCPSVQRENKPDYESDMVDNFKGDDNRASPAIIAKATGKIRESKPIRDIEDWRNQPAIEISDELKKSVSMGVA